MTRLGALVVVTCISAWGILFLGQDIWAASCDQECEVSKSCASYSECKTAHVQCLAACKEKEAWEISASAFEKAAQAQSELIKHLENQNVALEKLLMLIDSLILKLSKLGGQGEAQEPAAQAQALPGS